MPVHLPKILRKAPVNSLRAYFNTVSPDSFAAVDWSEKQTKLVRRLTDVINNLGDRAQKRVYTDFERVGQLMDDHGRTVLRSVLSADGGDLDAFDALEDVTACALHVLMLSGDTFERALSAAFAQRLLNGRDWTGIDFEPAVPPVMRADPRIDEFKDRMRYLFAADGPVPRVQIEQFERHDPDPAGSDTIERVQFTLYVEAPPERSLVFQEGEGTELEARVLRPVREAAILFDAAEKTLDVVVKGGGKKRRQAITAAFIDLMLEPGAIPASRPRRHLALDTLKTRPRFDTRPEDRVRTVEVVRLLLGAPDGSSIVSFETGSRNSDPANGDFYELAERALGPFGPLARQGWHVRAAKIRITFEPEASKKREKRVTIELKAPDRTNLRDQIELHRRIADELFMRWGLYEGSA